MNVKLNLRLDIENVKLIRERAPRAIARALNRSIVSARMFMVKNIASDTGLKSGTVKEQIRTHEARPNKLVAGLEVLGNRIPLIEFGAKGPEPSRGKGRGVTAKLKGGAGRYPHAFIATMKSGHRGVFQRTGETRLPIAELHGPSLPHVFNKYVEQGLARGHEALVKNLQSEMRFAMRNK